MRTAPKYPTKGNKGDVNVREETTKTDRNGQKLKKTDTN